MAVFAQSAQGVAHFAAAETRLLIARAKAIGTILKGLAVAIGGGALVIAFGLLVVPELYRHTGEPLCFLFFLVVVVPLGYGWHIIAPALPALFRRTVTDAPGSARWATFEDLKKAGVING
jgi:hypothetical protein